VNANPPIPLGRAWDICDRLVADLPHPSPAILSVEPAGDLRRFEPLVHSIVLVCLVADRDQARAEIGRALADADSVDSSDSRVLAVQHSATIDIRLASADEHGSVLFAATGSWRHVARLTKAGLPQHPFPDETSLYGSMGLPYIPAELRHDTGEVEAASSGELPVLLDVADMRGDLHMHSTYSDGRDAVEVMVEACHRLGYEYIAITDHSWGAAAARTLAVEAIAQQRDEIEALRERFPAMAILHGVEVDILPDGRLDFEDSVLEQFDIVLASLHNAAGHDPGRLTRRTLSAIHHPLVNIVCHPANRLVGRSSGYSLDFDAVYRAAAETGTALEVDGAPSHIDLDGARAREAVAAGVTLTVDSDCHRSDALGRQMRFGVGTARRGWVERPNVLNTRPIDEVRRFLAAKRAGRPGTL
jgi:DNA polymerase (family X)